MDPLEIRRRVFGGIIICSLSSTDEDELINSGLQWLYIERLGCLGINVSQPTEVIIFVTCLYINWADPITRIAQLTFHDSPTPHKLFAFDTDGEPTSAAFCATTTALISVIVSLSRLNRGSPSPAPNFGMPRLNIELVWLFLER